jgi:hypothetical protein
VHARERVEARNNSLPPRSDCITRCTSAKLHRARTVRPDGTAALVHASAGLVFFRAFDYLAGITEGVTHMATTQSGTAGSMSGTRASTSGGTQQGMIGQTPDTTYNLISVMYHTLQGCQTYEQYAQDAEQSGQQEIAQFFRDTGREFERCAQRGQQLLAQCLQQAQPGQGSRAGQLNSQMNRPSGQQSQMSGSSGQQGQSGTSRGQQGSSHASRSSSLGSSGSGMGSSGTSNMGSSGSNRGGSSR